MKASTQRTIMQIITAFALAFTYIALGFAVCAGIPSITEQLSSRFSLVEQSPFDAQQLTELALATRDYTVGSHDLDALMSAIEDANAANDTPYAQATQEELLTIVPDAYTLDQEAISHLDDVNALTSRFFMPILGIAVLAGFCLMATYRMYGSSAVSHALVFSGGAILILFAILGIWAFFGFASFFASFHAIFFENETWLFPANSLLITMYPEPFWIGMGLTWLVTSCLLAVLSVIVGILFRRRTQRTTAIDTTTSTSTHTTNVTVTTPTDDSTS